MAINKNFVIKNGVEVNTSLIVGDADLNKVGVGTTVPGYTLHVGGSRGGIGATDLTVTGIATVGTSGSTSAALSVVGVSSFQGDVNFLGSAGVSTITFDASLDKLNFADNARATFGADDDLQIFHDGSKSIIRETGTGNLVIEGTGETLASFIDDGAVELYYNNTKRLETTGFGVTIFDTLHSKQVNVSGASTFTGIATFNGANVYVDNDLFVGGVNINGGSGGALGIDLRTRNINASGIATITGQLGIGSIAAGAGLTVFGDVDITGLTTTNTLQVGNLGLNVTGVSTFSDDLAVGVSTLFADVSTGFVGVGTAVPGFPLEVRVDSVKRLQVDATGASVTGVVTGTSGGSFAQIKVGQSDINTITGEGASLNLDAGDGVGGIVNVNADVNLRLNHGLDVATGVSTFKNDLNVGFTTFFVDKSTGRIGIGTNVPSAALEVGATAGTGIGVSIFENGNAAFSGIVTVGGNLNVTGDITYDEVNGRNLNISGFSTFGNDLSVGVSTFFVDKSTGRIGIGTNVPSAALQVGATEGTGIGVSIHENGNAGFTGIVTVGGTLEATSAVVGSAVTINNTGINITGVATVNSVEITGGSAIGLDITTRNLNVSGVSTFANDLAVGVSTFFVDVSTGRIGIGTNAPSAALEVGATAGTGIGVSIFENGNGAFSGVVTASTFTGNLSGGTVSGTTGTFSGDVDIADKIVHTGDTNTAIRFPAADTFTVETAGTERLRVNSDGDVGVGTETAETPRGNRGLEVAGTTGAEFVATRFDDNLVDGDFVGGFVFKNLDAGGSPNHFAGMYAKANGTAGAMDLHFTGDRAQYEADTADLTIRSSNVGIGTTLPAQTLDIMSANPVIRLTDTDPAGVFSQIDGAGGDLILSADGGADSSDSFISLRIDGTDANAEKLRITDNNDVVLGGGATVGSSSGIVTFIGDGSQLTGVISGIDITEDAGLVGAAITNIKFTGSGISTVTTDTTVGIATISISGGGGGGVSETDTDVSTTTATGVGSFAVATHRSASIIAQIDQGANYQVGRYLMIHDGTTATVIEESAIATGDMLGSFSADVNNSNAELKVTMNSSGIATVTTKIDTVTV